MSNLFTFLTDLAVNPHGQIDFAHNPYATMTAAGLSDVEQAKLTSNNFSQNDVTPLSLFLREPDTDPSPDSDPLVQPSFFLREPDTDPSPDSDPLVQPSLIFREPDTDPSPDSNPLFPRQSKI